MNENLKHESEASTLKEGVESPELFRASLGFDFVFGLDKDGHKKAYCIEINGHDSGISGVADIPDDQISKTKKKAAAQRDFRNPEWERRSNIHNEILQSMYDGTFQVSDPELMDDIVNKYLGPSVDKITIFPHAFQNPGWLQDVTQYKALQANFIPTGMRPRQFGESDLVTHPPEYWIVKSNRGRGGQNIHIYTNAAFQDVYVDADKKTQERYVAQEFISPLGADNAPNERRGNPASLRVLVDFVILKTEQSTLYINRPTNVFLHIVGTITKIRTAR